MRPLLLLLLLFLTAACAQAAIPTDKVTQIRSLLRGHKVGAAESATNALLAAHPADAEVHALLASVFAAKGDADAAVKAGEKAVELAPANSEIQRQLGDTYGFAASKAGMLGKMGFAKKCRLAYEKAVGLDPKNLSARNSLMSFYQMAPGVMGGGPEKAQAQAEAIKQLDAGRGRIAYATLYIGEKKYAEAFVELDAALLATPDSYPALFQFGRLTALSGEQLDRGMAALKQCLTLTPTPGAPGHDAAHWRLGNIWEKKGDKSAALAAYQAALAVNPVFPQAIESLKKLD